MVSSPNHSPDGPDLRPGGHSALGSCWFPPWGILRRGGNVHSQWADGETEARGLGIPAQQQRAWRGTGRISWGWGGNSFGPEPLLTLGAPRSEPRAPAATPPGPGGSASPQPAAPGLGAAAPAARAASERDGVPLRPGRCLPARGRCTACGGRGRQPGRPGHHAGQRHPVPL